MTGPHITGLAARVEVPADVQKLPLAVHEDFGPAAGVRFALASAFDLVGVRGVENNGVTVGADLGPRKLEADEFRAARGEIRGARELDRKSVV